MGEFLAVNCFDHEETVEQDSGLKILVFYKAPSCKLCIYSSIRDGEVNCMLGACDSENKSLDDGSKKWCYLTGLLIQGGFVEKEEIWARSSNSFKSNKELLDEIGNDLKQHFDGLVKLLSSS
ncbi:TPA: hypothetical protein DDW35_01410 [Candidatus Sumerlaeota bacterium]|nr:hypothetical protein [Candidatus Sumerlaeota bacterium]